MLAPPRDHRRPPSHIIESHRTDPAAVNVVRSLGPTHTNADLADRLNAAGYLTGAGRPFDVPAVANLRSYHRIAPVVTLAPGEISAAAACRLEVTTTTIYGWVNTGALPARRGPGGRICIPFDAEVQAACQRRAAMSVHIVRHTTTKPAGEHEWTVKRVAAALAVNTNVVYYWLETCQLDARKGPGSRCSSATTPTSKTSAGPGSPTQACPPPSSIRLT